MRLPQGLAALHYQTDRYEEEEEEEKVRGGERSRIESEEEEGAGKYSSV